MRATRENDVYLAGFALPEAISLSTDLAATVAGCELVLGVTPSHAVRDVFGPVASALDPAAIIVNCSKGLEEGTLARVDQIYADILPAPIHARAVYLSGPTFAKELAAGLPAAIAVASADADSAAQVQAWLSSSRFRIYTADDVVGLLIGGALKNVIALAAGTSDGLGLGLNARAALITRGLAEITRIGVAQGADPLTFSGLSGMGDLVLTCSGELSRNRRVGLELGRGRGLSEIIGEMRMVAEGVKTARVAHELAAKMGVVAPVTQFMFEVLYQDRPARDAIAQLMGRSLKHERA